MTQRQQSLGQYIAALISDGSLNFQDCLSNPSSALARITLEVVRDARFVFSTVATEAGRRFMEKTFPFFGGTKK